MIVAVWEITAKFGKSGEVIALLKEWNEKFGSEVGMMANGERILQGSIGAPESTIQSVVTMNSLADLEAAFAKLGKLDGHAAWGKQMEPLIVSGSNRWQIYREV